MAAVQLDRIEGEFAVLVHLGESFDLPVSLLPEDAKEGDTLELSLQVNAEATQTARDSMAKKLAELSRNDDGGDFSL